MEKIGIIGAGAMGSGIAQVAATTGHDVLIYDTKPEALIASRDKLLKILNRLVEKSRISDAESKLIFSRHYFIDKFESLSTCDIIIEAIVENLDIKKSVFRQLESLCSPETILASNTSSLPVTAIASACQNPERVIGLHFFNPAPLMHLVEIIPALQTHEKLANRCQNLMQKWGKIPVVVKDTPGFIVNRIARPFYSEALRIFDEGIADKSTIDWAMTSIAKFRMGPFTLMDYIGHDVNFEVTRSMYQAYFQEPRYKPSFTQQRLVDAGYLGRKSGRGFYNYPMAEEKSVIEDLSLGQQIVDRIVAMLINEAADAYYYKIATREEIDIAMTKGVNYPKGLLKWADEIGIKQVAKTINELYEFYHEDRYRLSPGLSTKLNKNESFY